MTPEELQIFARALARAGTATALARVLKISKQAVWAWAQGKQNPSSINIRKMEHYIAGLVDENFPVRPTLPSRRR